MCGIVGLIHFDRRLVELPVLERMAATLAHRGPDEEGYFLDEAVGLYHKRLAIIDLTTGRQPMTADDVTVVFNGEIYNYVELREELKRRGRTFCTTSDTEVLLRMYLEYGPDFVARLNGMFAFVMYDQPRQRVVVARDHFGVKPLYYWRDARTLAFVSEIKALWGHPDLAPRADYDAVCDYLAFQFVLGDRTMFAGVRRIMPGHYQVIDLGSGATRTVQYWEPRFSTDFDHTEQYFVTELQRLLDDAVRLQLRSDVPVGAHLSGGMDSSLVTVLARRHHGGAFKTFTGLFREGPEFDESAYARQVAASAGVELYEVAPEAHDFVALLPKLVYHMDEPAAGPGLFPQYMVSRLAAQHVKVVLGGQGGDELFGGYARYVVAYLEQALKGAIFETNEEREHIVSLQSILPNLPYLRAYVPMFQQFWRQGVFEDMDRRYFRLLDRFWGSVSLLTDDFRARYRPEDLFGRFQHIFNHPSTLSYYNKMTHFDLIAHLPALLQVEDRTSMAVSLESRVPLLDYRIADLVTSVPPAMKFKGAEMKYLLKRAVGEWIPPAVLARKDKMGFPVPLHLWIRGKARDFAEDVLLSQTTRQRGLYNVDEVRKLLDRAPAFGRRVWGLLNLELWHRQFLDGRPAAVA